MTWAKLDDTFADHPKIDPLSDAAFRLHVAAICYSARHLTDGHIPTERITRLVPRYQKRHVTELVTAGLWEPAEGGYTIHDYLDYNPTRKQAIEDKDALSRVRAAAGRKGAAARWGKGSHDDNKL